MTEWGLLWAFSPVAVLLAGLSDALFGDPPWLPHPVRWIGRFAHTLENVLRRLPLPERGLGMIFTFLVLGTTGSVVAGSLWLSLQVHVSVAMAVQVLWLHWGIATRDLTHALQRIEEPLLRGDMENARRYTSWIVSRDVATLDEAGLCRAGIESGAENTVDGIAAPWFWALLGGPVGLWLFKAASTLDSQVGYKTTRHLRFGWASARLDDVLNWVPARLSLVVFTLAAVLQGKRKSIRRAWRVALRDRHLHASPNAGLAESWMAGYLGVRLMGPNMYHGIQNAKPWLGEEFATARSSDLRDVRVWIWLCGSLCWCITFCITMYNKP